MLAEIRSALRPAVVMLLLFSALTGLAYPLAVTGIAQVAFPHQANGSLIRDGGQVVGSELIAQGFASPRYFHPRPSAAGKGYDAGASAATNLAPGSKDLRDAIAARVADLRAQGLTGASVPADLVTTSASGLDPDISPEAALAQTARIARARGLAEPQVRALVESRTSYPLFGLIGEPHVNVLLLNRQLDRLSVKQVQ
ncbi:potassium-transporting ATPase subunit KdpC [Novosphingobium lentum]|uniref:potassium-transporting ATPase subunit KdpC n=1 Tax=Novosphingobium lentum TaxID=145287 RepID=UPI000833BEE2|nr:potassium-transporting ATPase subunit KdpC [Novosphingobium lentum]